MRTLLLGSVVRSAILAIPAALFFAACGNGGEREHAHDHEHEHAHDHEDSHDHEHEGDGEAHAEEGHHHAAPHGGALVALGDHFAHLEIVLDPAMGGLVAYVLDGEAEKALRIAQESLVLSVPSGQGDGSRLEAVLAAQANELTGETAGDSSEFRGEVPALKGATAFEATLAKIEIKGETIEGVKFGYPEGNE